MKIAMVGYIAPHINGLSSHLYTLSKKLVENGHEVFVISYPHREGLKDIDGIHVKGAKIIDIPFIRPLTFKISAKKILTDLVEKENIDIIHGHTLIPTGISSSRGS